MQKTFKLRRLSDAEFERVETLAQKGGVPLDQCPTCLATRVEVEPHVYGWENGTYKFRGEELECDCDMQMQLRKHYLVANIGEQYQRLNWLDYDGSEDVRKAVGNYLKHYDSARLNGMGIEFSGKTLGTGKTFAATHIAKELIKRGERVYFIPFLSIINLYEAPNGVDLEKYLKEVSVLVLDEVIPPETGPQAAFFARKFEELIRHRTNFNLPIVMTTNLDQGELRKHYPRPYSLLEAKQARVQVEGEDARMGKIGWENLEMLVNDEVRPIT